MDNKVTTLDNEKIIALIRAKYAAFQVKQEEARIIMAQLQGAAEAADFTAQQVNDILGVKLFTDAKVDQ